MPHMLIKLKRFRFAILVVGFLGWLGASAMAPGAANADPPSDDKAAKDDLKKLQGTWRLVSVKAKGQTTKGYGKNFGLVIKGDQFEKTYLDFVEQGGFFGAEEKTVSGTVTLDASKSPPRITLAYTEESAKLLGHQRAAGVYRWDDGQLTICWYNPAGEAPKEFKGGDDRVIFVLEKEKAEK
jgi:uncharacterized protein (TIGR03067 family)